jgi:hypothetical protein
MVMVVLVSAVYAPMKTSTPHSVAWLSDYFLESEFLEVDLLSASSRTEQTNEQIGRKQIGTNNIRADMELADKRTPPMDQHQNCSMLATRLHSQG